MFSFRGRSPFRRFAVPPRRMALPAPPARSGEGDASRRFGPRRGVEPGEGAGEDRTVLGLRVRPPLGRNESPKHSSDAFDHRRQALDEGGVGRGKARVARGGALEPGTVQPFEGPAHLPQQAEVEGCRGFAVSFAPGARAVQHVEAGPGRARQGGGGLLQRLDKVNRMSASQSLMVEYSPCK